MNILAMDTSSDVLSLACGQEDQGQMTIKAIDNSITGLQHGVSLVPAVDALFKQVGWSREDLDQIIVGIGPGSYTGLRIGVTLAKMWGVSTAKEVRTISSLALIAQQVASDNTYVIPIIDARRLSCYTNIYFKHGGQLQPQGPDVHTDWRQWQGFISEFFQDKAQAQVVLIGKDIQEFVEVFHENHGDIQLQVINETTIYPDASQVFKGLVSSKVDDLHLLAPFYAHASLAEQEWAAKNQQVNVEEDGNERYIEHFS